MKVRLSRIVPQTILNPEIMEVTFEIPEPVAKRLGYGREALPRRALEALLVDECSRGRLSRGKVAEILDLKDGPNPACKECSGANHDMPIKGMVILWGLKPDGNRKWAGGHVLDPNNGKTYKSKLELLDGGRKLGMSGCIAFICRQQVWVRQ